MKKSSVPEVIDSYIKISDKIQFREGLILCTVALLSAISFLIHYILNILSASISTFTVFSVSGLLFSGIGLVASKTYRKMTYF